MGFGVGETVVPFQVGIKVGGFDVVNHFLGVLVAKARCSSGDFGCFLFSALVCAVEIKMNKKNIT